MYLPPDAMHAERISAGELLAVRANAYQTHRDTCFCQKLMHEGSRLLIFYLNSDCPLVMPVSNVARVQEVN